MSLLSRVRSWFKSDDAPDAGSEEAPDERDAGGDAHGGEDAGTLGALGAPGEGREPPAQIQRLARVGLAEGPGVDEAIAVLRQVRGTMLEATAVQWALRGVGTRTIPDPVRVAVADILASRGDDPGALRILEGISSTPGLILAADLYAGSGQLARAVGTIERVLARDLDAPGARERHQRWSLSLGYTRRPARHLDEATVVAPQATGGPFRLLREVARGGAGAVYEAEDDLLGGASPSGLPRPGEGPGRARARGPDRGGARRPRRAPGARRRSGAGLGRPGVGRPGIHPRHAAHRRSRLPRPPSGAGPAPGPRLARIHAAGLAHADVKPANVLLRQPHDPVLGDFGIARPTGAPSEGGGSAGYLSPERLAGRPTDPRDGHLRYGRILEDRPPPARGGGI